MGRLQRYAETIRSFRRRRRRRSGGDEGGAAGDPPTITSIDVASGSSLGNTAIVVTGTGYTEPGVGVHTVLFGGAPATDVVVVNDTTINCNTPAGTPGSTFDVVLSNTNGSDTLSSEWSYHALPTITGASPGLSPSIGYTGAIITGTGFQDNGAGTNTLTIDGNACTSVVVDSDTQITCDVPAGTADSGPHNIVLSNNNGTNITGSAQWTYAAIPTITDVSPDRGPKDGSTSVTITGTGFQDQNPGTNSITIDGNACTSVSVVSDTTLTCNTPAGTAGSTFDVVLSNDNGSDTLTNGWTYNAEPTVTDANPNSGPEGGGTIVTLTGTGFANFSPGTNTVEFDGTPATGVVVDSDIQITCTTPAGTGTGDVTVTNNNGTGTLSSGFTYNPPGAVSLPALWLAALRKNRPYYEGGIFRKYQIRR